ncbi:unnamed protein product [Chrysodeixis includens]|uniref:Uncharacterized protein n=1 Tax=Chrysodeixis includens TaxID=689277 RepID=A0A9N8Q0R0_CHRIL|nr:unnamed protein product [Chrysodeixis includens]
MSRPPLVPILKMMGSLTFAYASSLITSCSTVVIDGTPIPWLTERTGPTLYIAYLCECLVRFTSFLFFSGRSNNSAMYCAKSRIRYFVPPMQTNLTSPNIAGRS